MQDAQTSPHAPKFDLAPRPLAASPTKKKAPATAAAPNTKKAKVAPKAQSTKTPVKRGRGRPRSAAKKPTPAKASGGVKKVTAPTKKKATPKKAASKDARYVVESILDSRVGTGAKPSREYLIKWEGYSSAHDTWEPEANLSAGLLKTYADQQKGKPAAKKPATPKKEAKAAAKKPAAAAAPKAASAKKAAAAAAKPTSPAKPAPKPASAKKAAAAKKAASPAKPGAKGAAKKLGVVKTGIAKPSPRRKSVVSPKAKPAPKAAAAKAVKAKSPAKKEAAAKPKAEPKKPKLAEGEFVVESILGHRNRTDTAGKTHAEYLIRWAGFDSAHDTWEPAKNLSRDLIKGYTASVAKPE